MHARYNTGRARIRYTTRRNLSGLRANPIEVARTPRDDRQGNDLGFVVVVVLLTA
ncbi:MAG: hypothetical protein OXU20_02945 [Myxococcales bacterium]|nr:hypothetical protein [Myxococcales bacterium]